MIKELDVKDKNRLLFHIKVDDYFATLATNLSLLDQIIKNGDIDSISKLIILDSTVADLMFLQKNYKIERKVHD